jgi:hypothetical protein
MPQYVGSANSTVGSWSTEAPDDFDWEAENGFWPVSRCRQCYVDYLTAKPLEYEEARVARHYYNGAQWSPDEIKVLRDRRQPIVTFNRTGRKIDQIVGMVQRIRTDPKAFPRNPRNADGAEIATQCVRSVLDGSDWDFLDAYCAGQAGIEGIAGVELKLIQGDHADPDLGMDFVFGDDFFYDPRSFKPDFSDARYMGIAKWLDVEAAVELFPNKEEDLRTLMTETGFDLTTHADREYKWIYVNEKRLRLVEMWYRHRSRWFWSFFVSMIMLDQGVSPFLNERNQPMNRFIMWSAYVDHDGDRYGFVRNIKGPQDELNQRRSKALFMTNATRIQATKGVVDDVERARKEYARPDGFVELNPGFEPPVILEKATELQANLNLMVDARNEVDSFANITPDLITRDIPGDHSGVAINLLQQAGIAELGSYLRNYKNWKKRVYRAIWNIVQRTWTAERFIRVTDSQGLAQFIQINGFGMDPNTGQPIIINAIGQLDVEMTMEEGPDEANLMHDAYDVLKNYPAGVIPPAVLIELSPLSSQMKQRVMQLMQAPVDPMMMQAKQVALQSEQAKTEELHARAERHRAQSVSDAARAAHLMSQAGLNAQEAYTQATMQEQNVNQGMAGASPAANFGFGSGGGIPPGGGPAGNAPPSPPQSMQIPANHPIMAHARKAPDGRMYVPHPGAPGRFMLVT